MLKKILIILALVLAISYLANRFFISPSSENVVSLKEGEKNKRETTPFSPPKSATLNPEALLAKIKNLFFEANPDIDFSVAIYDLKNDSYFGYNDNVAQHAASVSKVLTGIYLLKNVEEGKIDLNDQMGTYNVEFNLKQLINQSNNISWRMIDDLLGITPQDEYAHSLGLTSVNFEENLMSPKDAAMLFVKLYKGEILSEPYQRKLFSYMQNTETENLITPAIPKEIPFYHKTGLYEGEVHDVAIIDHPQRPFVLSIFSVNKLYPDYEGRAKLIQKVAAQVYAYFSEID